jgi:hypothetical protein
MGATLISGGWPSSANRLAITDMHDSLPFFSSLAIFCRQ